MALISKKKLMFDNLINISEKQGKYDTLFTENEADNQSIKLRNELEHIKREIENEE